MGQVVQIINVRDINKMIAVKKIKSTSWAKENVHTNSAKCTELEHLSVGSACYKISIG